MSLLESIKDFIQLFTDFSNPTNKFIVGKALFCTIFTLVLLYGGVLLIVGVAKVHERIRDFFIGQTPIGETSGGYEKQNKVTKSNNEDANDNDSWHPKDEPDTLAPVDTQVVQALKHKISPDVLIGKYTKTGFEAYDVYDYLSLLQNKCDMIGHYVKRDGSGNHDGFQVDVIGRQANITVIGHAKISVPIDNIEKLKDVMYLQEVITNDSVLSKMTYDF